MRRSAEFIHRTSVPNAAGAGELVGAASRPHMTRVRDGQNRGENLALHEH
jgi:hypothetical protein